MMARIYRVIRAPIAAGRLDPVRLFTGVGRVAIDTLRRTVVPS